MKNPCVFIVPIDVDNLIGYVFIDEDFNTLL